MFTVSINELEGFYLERFRVALSAEDHEARVAVLGHVKHEVVAGWLNALSEANGADWIREPHNQPLAAWIAGTAAERDEAIYEFTRVARAYEDRNERRLNIAEHAGKLIRNSILDGRRQGVQTPDGILYQVTFAGKEHKISGARDMDTVRKSWAAYRGVVHLGMAMDLFEDRPVPPEQVLSVAEKIRKQLSETSPKGTSKPYVPREEQISFIYKSDTWGPRIANRGLPISVRD